MQSVTAALSPLPHLLFLLFLLLLLVVTQCEVYHLADRSSDTMGMVVETTHARASVMSEIVMRMGCGLAVQQTTQTMGWRQLTRLRCLCIQVHRRVLELLSLDRKHRLLLTASCVLGCVALVH
jgi:hypothetical protein